MINSVENFIKTRKFVHNISPRTVEWYQTSLAWLPNESPTQGELEEMVIRMREKGLTVIGVNSLCRSINAYVHWTFSPNTKCSQSCNQHPKVQRLKEPVTVMPVYSSEQVKRIIQYKPRTMFERRVRMFALLCLDIGCRASEALSLRVSAIDMDNLLITLDGKGGKQRIVPFSIPLRLALHKYAAPLKKEELLFSSVHGTSIIRRNMGRAVHTWCRNTLGFNPPKRSIHAFRHTFAVNYLRKGGSVFHLQKMLGHSTLEMTRRYANLQTQDLQAVHQKLSMLSGM